MGAPLRLRGRAAFPEALSSGSLHVCRSFGDDRAAPTGQNSGHRVWEREHVTRFLRSSALAASSLAPTAGSFVAVRALDSSSGLAAVGFLAGLQVVAAVATLLADMNIGPAGIRLLAQASDRDRVALITQLRAITLAGACVLGAVGALLSAAVGPMVLGPRAAWWSFGAAALAGGFGMCAAQELNILTGLGKVWAVAISLGVQGLVGLASALIVLTQQTRHAAEWYLLVSTAAQIVTTMSISKVAMRASRRSVRGSPDDRRSFRSQLAGISRLLDGSVTTTSAVLLGAGSVALAPLVVQWVAGYEAAGSFRVATMVATVAAAAFTPVIARVWFPLAATAPIDRLSAEARRHVRQSLLAAGSAVSVLALAAPAISRVLAGNTAQATSIRARLLVEVPRAIALVYTYAVLARMPAKVFLRVEFCSAILLGCGVYVGARLAGATGASIGLCAGVVAYGCIAFGVLRSSGRPWTVRRSSRETERSSEGQAASSAHVGVHEEPWPQDRRSGVVFDAG